MLRASASRRSCSRATRRLVARQSHIQKWWASLPTPRPEYFTPLALTLALNENTRRLALALRLLGWQSVVRRVHGKSTRFWLPPDSPVTRRPRGRPRLTNSTQPH